MIIEIFNIQAKNIDNRIILNDFIKLEVLVTKKTLKTFYNTLMRLFAISIYSRVIIL